MLTPRPVYPGRILLARRGGIGQITLPSRATPSAMAAAAAFTRRGLWGLGQDPGTIDPVTGMPMGTDTSGGTTANCNPQTGQCAPVGSGGAGGGGTTPPGGINWTSILTSGITAVGKVVQQQTNPFAPKNIPAGYVYQSGPGGTFISAGGAGTIGVSPLTGTTLNNLLPILLVGGALVLFMSMAKK